MRSFLVEKKNEFFFSFQFVLFFSSFSRRSHDGDPPSLSLRGRTLGSFHPTREKGVGRASGRRPRESSRLLARRTRYIYKILQHFLSSSSFFLSSRFSFFFFFVRANNFLAAESIHRVFFYLAPSIRTNETGTIFRPVFVIIAQFGSLKFYLFLFFSFLFFFFMESIL